MTEEKKKEYAVYAGLALVALLAFLHQENRAERFRQRDCSGMNPEKGPMSI